MSFHSLQETAFSSDNGLRDDVNWLHVSEWNCLSQLLNHLLGREGSYRTKAEPIRLHETLILLHIFFPEHEVAPGFFSRREHFLPPFLRNKPNAGKLVGEADTENSWVCVKKNGCTLGFFMSTAEVRTVFF